MTLWGYFSCKCPRTPKKFKLWTMTVPCIHDTWATKLCQVDTVAFFSSTEQSTLNACNSDKSLCCCMRSSEQICCFVLFLYCIHRSALQHEGFGSYQEGEIPQGSSCGGQNCIYTGYSHKCLGGSGTLQNQNQCFLPIDHFSRWEPCCSLSKYFGESVEHSYC